VRGYVIIAAQDLVSMMGIVRIDGSAKESIRLAGASVINKPFKTRKHHALNHGARRSRLRAESRSNEEESALTELQA